MALVGTSSRGNLEPKDALSAAADDDDEVLRVPPLTPAVHYDIKAIRSGASFSLAACRDLGRGGPGDELAAQRREQARIALEDIRALERQMHQLTRLAIARRWSARALLPLLVPLVARAVSWLCYDIPRSFRMAFAGDPARGQLNPAMVADPGTAAWQKVWAAAVDSFTPSTDGATGAKVETAMVTWNQAYPDRGLQLTVTIPSPPPLPLTHPAQPVGAPWSASSPFTARGRLLTTVQSGGFAFICVGAVASFLVLQNEAVLHLARKMARRLQEAREKLERQDEVTEKETAVLSHWSWAILLRSC